MTEGDFGTGAAVASAFMFGFQPWTTVLIKKSKHNSGRKSKYSPQWRLLLALQPILKEDYVKMTQQQPDESRQAVSS
ncbi:hypothetical protein PBOR_04100 [Paenibacillus borealis]|uniref:Uncharacterized protein n=1 Tax=Paenibacillus borealis TaxID=160799 RepID=A0A089LAQ0_PAEBO|nr:hypothetical protein PBOR_04100 [Paenibacillus borealis]